MLDTTRTTTALLEGLREPANTEVWREFDSRYRPIVMGFLRRLGLDEDDAADVAQETMTQFVQEYRQGRYDRQRGRLRTWLIALAKTQLAAMRRRTARRREWRGDSALENLPDDERLTWLWESELRTVMLRDAMDHLRQTTRTREKTIHAFELLVVRQSPVDSVAETLEMTVPDVYRAKSRVAQRLRGILTAIEGSYEEGA